MAQRVPEGVPLELAALAEPLAVACHANRRGGTGPGKTVNIVGSGTIGLLCLTVALSLGAGVDVVTDIDPDKLQKAGRLGAARPSDVRRSRIVEELRESRFERADIIVVAATALDSLVAGAALTRPGGRVVLLGLYGDTAPIAASAPDGFPLWVSEVEPGSTHDLSAAREHVLARGRVTPTVLAQERWLPLGSAQQDPRP